MRDEYFEYLNIARTSMIILGIFMHAALIYSPIYVYPIKDESVHTVFYYLFAVGHAFRMNVFLVVSGFVFAISIQKHGFKSGIKKRLVRLGVPLLVVGFTFNLLMYQTLENVKYSDDFFKFIMFGTWHAHLWFLGNLIIYCNISYFNWINFSKLRSDSMINNIIFVTLIFCTLCLNLHYLSIYWLIKTHTITFFCFNIHKLLWYYPSFLLGYYGYMNQDIFNKMIHLPVAIGNYLLALLFNLVIFLNQSKLSWKVLTVLMKMSDAYIALTLSILIIGICKLCEGKHWLLDKLHDAFYTIFLLHLPFIFFIYYFIKHLHLGLAGYFVTTFGCWMITWAIHEFIVKRYKFMRFLLNGIK